MIWFALALAAAGCSLLAVSLAAYATGRISQHALNGLLTVCNSLNLASAVLRNDRITGGIVAGALALSAWLWWHGGGGDGTKRRLRSWGRKFTGVRRTAPAGAS